MRRRSTTRLTVLLCALVLVFTSNMVNTCMGKERSSISITASPKNVMIGENITISGSINVTHDGVTVYILHREVGEPWTPLEEVLTNSSSQYSHDWNTTSSAPGTYEVKSYWLGDADTYGNESSVETVDIVGVHDVAVKNVAPSPIEVTFGETVDIDVTVINEGDYTETFDVYVYGDTDTAIIGDEYEAGTISDITLSPGVSAFRGITWDTTGVSEGTYTISAEASQVPGETDTDDNTYIDDTVSVVSPEKPPVAHFTYSPETPTTEIVTFNASDSDDPDGTIESFFWDFGDGSNATGEIVDHSYADNGTYTVILNVTDNDGLSNTTSKDVTVLNRSPDAIFTESAESADTGEAITFNASDSYDPDGTIDSFFWDFGDGSNATGEIVDHKYEDNGTYTVTLTVTDDDGATNSTSASKTVLNRPPVAAFTESAETVSINETLYFNASDSYDPDGSIDSYRWDFGDNSTATGVTAEHSYLQHGNYTVTLTITDDDGAKETATAVKTVLNRPPAALIAESAETVYTGEIITFNASGSSDPDGSILSYFWDFGDGSNATGVIVDHTYVDDGVYTVTLTVTDDDGATATARSNKTVLNRPPVASLNASAETVDTGEVVTFNASASYDPDGSVVRYFWDFGDGTDAIGVTVNHTYEDDGNYTVTLTVTDDDGEAASKSAVKRVLNRPPIASFTQNATIVDVKALLRFNASGSSDPDGSILSYFWDFGDGSNATMAVVLDHVYSEGGNHTVTLTLIDDDGATSSMTATVTARASLAWPLDLIAGIGLGIVALAGTAIYVVYGRRKKS